MKLFKWYNVRVLLMIISVIGLYSFASQRNDNRKLIGPEVNFKADDLPLIEPQTVNILLIENKSSASAFRKVQVDLNLLEQAVDANPMVEKSQVYVTIDGILKAEVKQKTPIARVFAQNDSHYIDYQGEEMPLSTNYTAHVPIVSGTTDVGIERDLRKVLQRIYEDPFLRKDIVGVEVQSGSNLILRNRDHDFLIDFGKPINVERKFENYKAFCQKAIIDSTLDNYKTINLKFTQQVVCTKK